MGHVGGISSILIPGSREQNSDSMEHFTNPYMDTKQRCEAEVRPLLKKFSPDIIALDPGSVARGWGRGEQFNPATASYEGYG